MNQLKIDNADDDLDYNKELNSKCICNIRLPWKNDEIVMIYPCEHLFHEKCVKAMLQCPLCKMHITRTYTLYDCNVHPQRFADMLSMSYYADMCSSNASTFIDSIFEIATFVAHIPFVHDKTDGRRMCERLFALNNITMKVHGLEKLKQEPKKVFICNHSAHLELAIIYYLFGAGFLATNIIGNSPYIDYIKNIVPLLTVSRGNEKMSTVKMMQDFVENNGSICVFPEGFLTHPDTICRFRTGAFHIGFPVYGIIIKYNDIVVDGYVNGFLYKLCGKRDINIDVHIIGPFYPPFNDKSINKIRYIMATKGGFVLSRVSNRDVNDATDDQNV